MVAVAGLQPRAVPEFLADAFLLLVQGHGFVQATASPGDKGLVADPARKAVTLVVLLRCAAHSVGNLESLGQVPDAPSEAETEIRQRVEAGSGFRIGIGLERSLEREFVIGQVLLALLPVAFPLAVRVENGLHVPAVEGCVIGRRPHECVQAIAAVRAVQLFNQ